MITAIASGLHGWDFRKEGDDRFDPTTKGLVMAVHCLLWGAIGFLVVGLYGLSAALLALAWWGVFRRKRQAKIELNKMDTWNAPHPSYMDVLKAHYYTGFLTILGLYFYNYDMRPELVNNGKFFDCRRPAELLTGLTGDLMITAYLIGLTW